jgi:hypothetical protein
MTANVFLSEKKKKWRVITPAICSFLTIMFIFFVDEGHYNFKWIHQRENLIAFAIYVIGFLFSQLITSLIIFRNYRGKNKTRLLTLVTVALGLFFTLSFFSFIHHL